MNMKKKLWLTAVVLAVFALVFSGCGGGGGSKSELTGTVEITGTLEVNRTVTADISELDGDGEPSYQWKIGDSAEDDFTDIDGANEETYTLAAADEGKYIAVSVGREGYSGEITSATRGPVAKAGTNPPDNNNNGGDDDGYNITKIIFVLNNPGAWGATGKPLPEGGWLGHLDTSNDDFVPKDSDGHDKFESWNQIYTAPAGSLLRVKIRKSPTDNSPDSQGRLWLHFFFYTLALDTGTGNLIDGGDWVNLESAEDDLLTFSGNDPLTRDFDLYDDQGNHKLKVPSNKDINAFRMYANNGYEVYEEVQLLVPKGN